MDAEKVSEWVRSREDVLNLLSYMILCAPDDFPEEDFLAKDEQMSLEKAFSDLRKGLELYVPAEEAAAAKSLIDESHRAFQQGNDARALKCLRDIQTCLK